MKKLNSLDLTISEAIKFSNEKIENCVFDEKEIEQIFKATFSAVRSDENRMNQIDDRILAIIEQASKRVIDSSSDQ